MDPRIVLVRRTTEYESLLKEHGTPQMAAFKLKQQGLEIGAVEQLHHTVLAASAHVLGAVPTTWRKAWVLREDLDRFRFDPTDVIMAVGWDGLVPNVAKYLTGQPVFGVNPFQAAQKMMQWGPIAAGKIYKNLDSVLKNQVENRTMVKVTLSNGRSLVAMNEIFLGHKSHQSAKYDIRHRNSSEYHSSSGMIVSTGTGMTGWALSLSNSMKIDVPRLYSEVQPTKPYLMFIVREAWSGPGTGTSIQHGIVSATSPLSVTSKIQEGGTIFGDGIESDSLDFNWGEEATFAPSEVALRLVTP